MNLQDKIKSYYLKHPDLRILFLFDPAGDSLQEVEQLPQDGYQVVYYENNPFNLKLKFHKEWLDEKIFLYLPVKRPTTNKEYLKFPLLDLLIANRELRLDDVGELMDEFKLKPQHQSLVQRYKNELKHTSVQKVAAKVLRPGRMDEKDLQKALISAFLRFQQPETTALLLAKMLTLGLKSEDAELKRFQNKIKENKLSEVIDQWTNEYFGEPLGELSVDRFKELAAKLKYNLITAGILTNPNDPYLTLKLEDPYRINNLIALKDQALYNPTLRDKFSWVLEELSKQVRETQLVDTYGVHAGYAWLNKELVSLMQATVVKMVTMDPLAEIALLEQIFSWEGLKDDVLEANKFLFHTAQMLQQIKEVNTFTLDTPAEYVSEYTSQWSQIDMHYRKAALAYTGIDFTGNIYVELYRNAKDTIESAYLSFINGTNREWLSCLSSKGFDYSTLELPLQYNFYTEEIEPLKQKVAVVISDALRYEVAAELLKEIHKDTYSIAHLNQRVASIPSTTAIGMTNLLPGKSFQMTGSKITADGVSTEAGKREAILKNANEDSRAISYKKVMEMSQTEARELFKSQIVYVYHDVIDSIGHKRASEKQTLPSIETGAIPELKKLIKYLHSSMNISRVFVTADHGFIYNDRSINEKEFEPSIPGDAMIETFKNRHGFLETESQLESGYCIPFNKVNKIKSDKYVIIPDGVNRYHRQGAGVQFVHGGGSLQELVVPVIESHSKKTKAIPKVKPVLLTQTLSVVSNTLKLEILQGNPVSNSEKERTIMVGLYDGNNLVSNLEEIRMNSSSDQPTMRIFSTNLILLPDQAGKSRFTLRIFDVEDDLNRLIEKDVDNTTLYGTDF